MKSRQRVVFIWFGFFGQIWAKCAHDAAPVTGVGVLKNDAGRAYHPPPIHARVLSDKY